MNTLKLFELRVTTQDIRFRCIEIKYFIKDQALHLAKKNRWIVRRVKPCNSHTRPGLGKDFPLGVGQGRHHQKTRYLSQIQASLLISAVLF